MAMRSQPISRVTRPFTTASMRGRDRSPDRPSLKRRRVDDSGSYAADLGMSSKIADARIARGTELRLGSSMLKVIVGSDDAKTTFMVHEDALCDRSEYIRTSMKPGWAAMRTDAQTIELPDDDPDAFSIYQTWLYSGKLPILSDAVDADYASSMELYHSLSYAYVLGERLIDVPFKNAIADAYVLFARGEAPARRAYPSCEDIRIIYEGTHVDSPIRRLIVDIWWCRGKVEWIEKDDDLPQEFLASVCKELMNLKATAECRVSRPWKTEHEQYHEKVIANETQRSEPQESGPDDDGTISIVRT